MTRKRRYLIFTAVPVTCIGAALGVLAMLPHGPGVTKANFDRIEVGMTVHDSVQLLGPPSSFMMRRTEVFTGSDGAQIVLQTEFNSGSGMHHVTSKKWNESTETIPDKLFRWLHLPK